MFKGLDLPVFYEAEVVVAGAGPAGIAAAIAAGKLGKSVVLLEQSGTPGGLGTAGLVPAVIYQSDGKNWVSGDICRTIIEDCCKEMGIRKVVPGWQEVHPEIMKRLYDDRLQKAGVKIFYGVKVADVVMDGERIESLLVSTYNGLQKVKGKSYVDATGDAAVACFAKAPFEFGDEKGNTMSPTLCPQFSNVDIDQYNKSRNSCRRDREIWEELTARGEAPIVEGHFVGVCTYGNGTTSGNLGHIYGTNCIDEEQVTNAYIEGRKMAKIYHDFFRQHVPGFEKSDLVNTASLLGVRESRRIVGEYQLNQTDYINRSNFDDEIGRFSYPIDIHASDSDIEAQRAVEKTLRESCYKPGESYGIPYRSLIPKKVTNLLVAGRCLSADRAIQSSVRVIPGCFITGQAAGVAASLADETRKVDVKELQRTLVEKIGADMIRL